MGRVHIWRPNARATISTHPDITQYLELARGDDERAVKTWWEESGYLLPDFVVAPNAFDSRTNSVIGANVRRILPKDTLIAVMIHGRKRRERLDMCNWLIENEYLPMFPRFMNNEKSPSVPLTRVQLLHEMRPLLDRELDQLFVCHAWHEHKETPALNYIESTSNSWEILGR